MSDRLLLTFSLAGANPCYRGVRRRRIQWGLLPRVHRDATASLQLHLQHFYTHYSVVIRPACDMEANPASFIPSTPQTSYIRSSQHSDRATRSGHTAEQASQESLRSLGNGTGPRLQTSSSNVSQLTAYTDLTSPSELAPEQDYEQQYATSRADIARIRTPEELQGTRRNDSHAVASPVSVLSPVATNGTKRTASGHVKNAPSLPSTPLTTTFAGKRSRADSISSTGSRAGELAWTLKARLGYAMAKVQHGWEHKSINEVEQLAAHKMSPHRHSMSHLDYSRRPLSSGLTNGAERLSMYEPSAHRYGYGNSSTDHPSKRHSGNYSSFMPPSLPDLAAAPRLQPAPDIRPTSQRYHHNHPISSSQPVYPTTAMSPPRTPVNGHARRPPTIRTELQTAEAERDALQALFQLGSPHSSQVPWQQNSQASSSQASPLRTEFTATPRKVTFARSESDSSARRSSVSEESAVLEAREGVMQEV